MMDKSKDYGKLHIILNLIGRDDLREEIDSKFSKEEQSELYYMFKDILADEMRFVINVYEQNASSTSISLKQ